MTGPLNKIESVIVGSLLGFICPVSLFFASWWIGFFVLPGSALPMAAIAGLLVGILLDIIFLRRWMKHVYKLHAGLLMFIYLLLSLVVLMVCMGVPVLNAALGVVAGAYVGRKLRHAGASRRHIRRSVKHVCMFTTVVIAAVCFLSASVALVSPSTPSDLQRMLGLQFAVTKPMIIGLIVLGGLALTLLQYWLTAAAAMGAYRLGKDVTRLE